MVKYSDRKIELTEATFECPAPIKNIIEINGRDVLVLLETTGKYDEFKDDTRCRNVWRLGSDGSVQWRIQKADIVSGDCGSFSSIWEESETVWAYNTNGLAYQVDPERGTLGETRQMK